MIKKLREEDRSQVISFLEEEAAINLFILGDIENFGFDKEFQELWGYYDDNGQLKGVLLHYYENYIPYYKSHAKDCDALISGFKEIIKNDKNTKIVSGKEEIVNEFKDVFNSTHEKATFFCELKDNAKLINSEPQPYTIKIATKKDATRVYELLETIEEFTMTDTNSIERIERTIETNNGRIYYIENEDKEMVSVSQTTAENTYSAMIVGVATIEEFRKQGLMRACLSKLCLDVLEEGRSLCLFYDNPEAGKIYHCIGFQTIGKWKMLIR